MTLAASDDAGSQLQWTSALTDWQVDPLTTAVVIAVGAMYMSRWRMARSRGRNAPVRRLLAFLSGLAVLLIAADSAIGTLDTTLFSVHMVQHILLLVVAPPLLARGAPVTLLLQTSGGTVRRRAMALVHSGPVSVMTHPLVAVAAFVVVLYMTHFTFIYDTALRSDVVHELEHAAYLTLGLLLWLPLVGADPMPRRLAPPLGMVMLAVVGPYMAILGLVIHGAEAPLFATHAARTAALGIDPLADQRVAGGIMWFAAPLLMVPSFLWLGITWARRDARRAAAGDRARARAAGPASDAMTPVWWR